jgi:transposase-like protein
MKTTPLAQHCPFLDCPSHRAGRRARIVRHSWLKTRRGVRQRRRCKDCGKTFLPSTGTLYHRLRHKPATLDRVVSMGAEGVSKTGIARVMSVSWSTADRWIDRASIQLQKFSQAHLEVADPVELQLDEVRASRSNDHKSVWIYSGI